MSINHDHIRLYIWLVVWNIFIFVPYIGNVIIPTDFPIFQRGRSTTNQIYDYPWWIISIMNHFQILLYIHYESSNRIHNSMDIYIYTSFPHNFQSSPSNSSHREPSNLGCQGKPARAPVDELQAPCCKGDRIYQYSNIILYCIILYYIILYYIIILYCIILYYIILYKWEMLVEDLEQKHDF